MAWRVALIDSCGEWPGAGQAASFVAAGRRVERRDPVADPTGHGSRIADLLLRARAIDLRLGQVFTSAAPTTSAAVAAAVDWAVAGRADLIHLSLGLAADRAVLREAIARALAAGVVVVAAAPARGAAPAGDASTAKGPARCGPVYPASYEGVIRGTGDARCAPGEISVLGAALFGACPRPTARDVDKPKAKAGGASIGAAWLTWSLTAGPPTPSVAEAVRCLAAAARYHGPERRPAPPTLPLIASH